MRPAKHQLPSIPDSLTDVALVDAATAAAPGGMSVSWWHERVRTGEAPSPVVRLPKCTRWALRDVRQFWQDFVEKSAASPGTAALLEASRKGSAAAAEARKRRASASQ